jgi:hypothetical protein
MGGEGEMDDEWRTSSSCTPFRGIRGRNGTSLLLVLGKVAEARTSTGCMK